MEEKRKNKRLDLDVNVQLERLDEDGVTTLKFVHVDVTDISKSGIGFDCKKKLEMNSYYDAKIQIWTKEVVDAVIQIVRSEEKRTHRRETCKVLHRYGENRPGQRKNNGI